MAFQINSTATVMQCAAGEPIVFSYQSANAAGIPEDLTGRSFVFSIYNSSRDSLGYFPSEIVSLVSGQAALWRLDGAVTEGLFSKPGLKWEVAERLDNGRDVVARGTITIEESAPGVIDYDAAPTARYVIRIKRMADMSALNSSLFVVDTQYIAAPVVVPPKFTSNPSISPASAIVGATLTATDGAMDAGGVVLSRRWLLDGTSIGTGTTVVPVITGTLVLENTGTGNVIATSTAVTVSPAPTPTPTPAPYPQFAVGTKLSVIGDSLTAHGTGGASPGNRLVRKINAGELEQAQAVNPRFAFEQWPADTTARDNAAAGGTSTYSKQWVDGANRAVSGSPANFHAALLSSTLAMGAPIFEYSATINSASLPDAENYIIKNILIPAMNADKFLLVGTMRPWAFSGGGLDTAANRASRLRINAAIRSWVSSVGPTKALLLDWDVAYGPIDGDGYANAALFYDTLHINSYGAAIGRAYLDTRLDLILPSGNLLLARTGANRQPNGAFTGTTGTAAGTVSGTVPTGYRLVSASGTAATAVASLEANASTGGQTIVVTAQPVAGSIAEEGFNLTFGTAGTIPVADMAGQYVATYFEVEVSGNPFVGIPTSFLYDAGSLQEARALDLDTQFGNSSKADGVAKTYWVATDPILVGASSTGPNVTLRLRMRGAEAFAAGAAPITIKVKQAWTGIVGDPKARWNAA